MIENAESPPGIGVDINDSDFLPGSGSATGLSDFVRNAEFAGRKHHNTPSV